MRESLNRINKKIKLKGIELNPVLSEEEVEKIEQNVGFGKMKDILPWSEVKLN